jgi:hypothetical protein
MDCPLPSTMVHGIMHYEHEDCGAVVGVLDEPYSTKPAQRRSHTCLPGYIGWTDTVPAYVDWRACTATPLSGVS